MLRVRTVLTGWGGAPGLNTFYFSSAGGGASATASEGHVRVHAFWEAIKQDFAPSFQATTDQVIDEVDETNGNLVASHSVITANVTTGTSGSINYLPCQTMAFLRLKSAEIAGDPPRRVRGGSYIGPYGLYANGINGTMDSVAMLRLANAAIALMAPLTSGGQLTIWHRPSAPGATDGGSCDVIDTSVRPKWAVLTSRRE